MVANGNTFARRVGSQAMAAGNVERMDQVVQASQKRQKEKDPEEVRAARAASYKRKKEKDPE